MFVRLIRRLRRRIHARVLSHLPGMLPQDLFRRLVNRERARSDRSRRPFSVVVIHLLEMNLQALRRAPGLITACIREIDDLGWFDADELGVLLPETDGEGARLFGAKIKAAFDASPCAAAIRFYTYRPECEQPEACGQVACGGSCQTGNQPRTGPLLAGVPDAEPPPGIDEGLPEEVPRGLSRMFIAPVPAWKRLMDIAVASVMLALLSPVLLCLAVVIKATSPGPVIFRQRRAGIGGRPFWFFKFRTMHVDAEERKQELLHLNEAAGPVFKIEHDPRLTPVGRLLRRSSLDELPQLWNVLKGDMSLVGPRPPTLDEVPKYQPWQRRRLEVIGGLTCIWQVSGRCLVPFEEWMRMDLRYTHRVSMWTDVVLLFKTVGAVVSRRGAR